MAMNLRRDIAQGREARSAGQTPLSGLGFSDTASSIAQQKYSLFLVSRNSRILDGRSLGIKNSEREKIFL
jgi:hypothetical protein